MTKIILAYMAGLCMGAAILFDHADDLKASMLHELRQAQSDRLLAQLHQAKAEASSAAPKPAASKHAPVKPETKEAPHAS